MHLKSMENAFSLKEKMPSSQAEPRARSASQRLLPIRARMSPSSPGRSGGRDVVNDLSAKYEGKFSFYKTDISDMQNCRDSVNRHMADNKKIDILVNNAGIGTAGRFIDMDENLTDWFECFDVDLHGAENELSSHQAYARAGSGHIINIVQRRRDYQQAVSDGVRRRKPPSTTLPGALPQRSPPTASASTPSRRASPSPTLSRASPMRRIRRFARIFPSAASKPTFEIGALAVYLASDISDIVTGAIFTADGGYSLQH